MSGILSMQSTSLEALKIIKPTLNDRQRVVYNLLFANKKPLTNMEICRKLRWEINCVTGRTKELRKKKLVQYCGKRRCEITGFNAMTWGPIEEQMEMGL